MDKSTVDLTFSDIVLIILKKKLLIGLITLFFSIVGIIYSFSVNEVYQSSARLITKENNSNLSSVFGSFSGLSALGGLAEGPKNTNTIYAEELIVSKEFILNLMIKNNMLNYFYAFEAWDKSSNEIFYNNESLINTKEYIKNLNSLDTRVISDEIFNVYMDLIDLKKNKNGVYTITFNYYSPHVAQEFLEILIRSVNEYIRINDLKKSDLAIKYLSSQLDTNTNNAVKDSVGKLIEANLNTKMLAMISADDYVFELIEKPNLSGKKVYPSKTRILLLFSLIGFLISVSFVLILYFIKNDLKAED